MMRFATIAVWVPLFLVSLIGPASARPLVWEAWGENAVAANTLGVIAGVAGLGVNYQTWDTNGKAAGTQQPDTTA